MESTAITNTTELQSMIQQLKIVDAKQQTLLAQRFSSPAAILVTAKSLIPIPIDHKINGPSFHLDVAEILSRFVVPLTLNNTIFRNSNFFVKALVRFISPKVIKPIIKGPAEHFLKKSEHLFYGWLAKLGNIKSKRNTNRQLGHVAISKTVGFSKQHM